MQERGQTNLDFAIGVSILLITVVAALTFIPGLFSTVDQGRADSDEVAANRLASTLVEGGLGHPGDPGQIDVDCTMALYDPGTDYCGFGSSPFEDHVAIEDRFFNVSLRAGSEHVCWDDDANALALATGACSDAGDVIFTAGGTPTRGSDVAVARRPVSIDGYEASLIVRVW